MAEIRKTLEVDVPVTTAYDQWSRFESFPIFMGNVREVDRVSEDEVFFRTHVKGVDRSWMAKIVTNEPDQEISWESLEGPKNHGRVRFEPLGTARTRVVLELDYEPEDWRERLGNLTGLVDRSVGEDLERFKSFIERKEQSTHER